MGLQAVIFDMDGVLTNTVEYHYQSWKGVFEFYNIPFTRQDNDQLLGLTRRRSLELILGSRRFEEEQIQEILRKKNEAFLEIVSRMGPSDLLPGVLPLLKECRAAGLRLGVASASRNAALVLEKLGVAGYFDHVTDGSYNLRSKPAPDTYQRTAQTLNTPAIDCIAIEDGEAGVRAALVAGMCVIGVGPERLVGKAHAIFPDLTRVRLRLLRAVYELWHATQPASHLDTYTQAML